MTSRWLPFVFAAVSACGGGASESPPPKVESDPHFVMMVNGQPAWPPTGPGCDALVTCCNEAKPGRPEVDLGCQIAAAAHDCANGRQGVIELLEHANAAIPASCH